MVLRCFGATVKQKCCSQKMVLRLCSAAVLRLTAHAEVHDTEGESVIRHSFCGMLIFFKRKLLPPFDPMLVR